MTEAEKFLRERGMDPAQMTGRFHFSDFDNYCREREVRDEFIVAFGFAILTTSAICSIQKYGPLLEVGCGSGYWSYELRKAGMDIVATDPGTGRYRFGAALTQWEKPWVEIERMGGVEAVKRYPTRTLLTVWPDMKPWPAKTLREFTADVVLYVGEGSGGCTGNDKFHDLLEEKFKPAGRIDLPSFEGIHDDLQIWRKIKP